METANPYFERMPNNLRHEAPRPRVGILDRARNFTQRLASSAARWVGIGESPAVPELSEPQPYSQVDDLYNQVDAVRSRHETEEASNQGGLVGGMRNAFARVSQKLGEIDFTQLKYDLFPASEPAENIAERERTRYLNILNNESSFLESHGKVKGQFIQAEGLSQRMMDQVTETTERSIVTLATRYLNRGGTLGDADYVRLRKLADKFLANPYSDSFFDADTRHMLTWVKQNVRLGSDPPPYHETPPEYVQYGL